MTHDPLCWYADQDKIPAAAVNDGWPCVCYLIVRVREGERAIVVSEFMSNHGDIATFELGYAAALNAAEATLATCTWDKGLNGSFDAVVTNVITEAIAAIRELKEKS